SSVSRRWSTGPSGRPCHAPGTRTATSSACRSTRGGTRTSTWPQTAATRSGLSAPMASRVETARLQTSTAGTSESFWCAARARGAPRPAGRGGFTLVEALVALAVSALVLVALYGAVVRAGVVRERAGRSAERLTKARMLLRRQRVEGRVDAPRAAARGRAGGRGGRRRGRCPGADDGGRAAARGRVVMRLLGLEVTAHEVRVARGERSFGTLRLTALERWPLTGPAALPGVLAEIAGARADVVLTALPASAATHRFLTFPFRDRG